MSCFLLADDEETSGKINIDELYDKNHRRDQKQLSIFNKILNRVHRRIQSTTKSKNNDKYIWFTVPEYIFGEPIYNQGDCIGYLVVKLEANGFAVKYVHPNTLFVSWQNWVPSYVRHEIKKKTGKIIDEKGNVIGDKYADEDNEEQSDPSDPNAGLFNERRNVLQKGGKEYTPVQEYQPTGNFVYNKEMFDQLGKKIG